MMKKTQLLIAFFIGFSVPVFSQGTTILDLRDVLMLVKQNHPVAIQAGIVADQGDAYLLKARGEFDPKFSFEKNNKFYTGKNYYDLASYGLSVPTWPGADLYLGTNQNSGVYLNPDETTPPGGLSTIGGNISLLRNLITDQRRTLLKQAKLLKNQNQAVRSLYLNQLCADVLQAYTDWYIAWKEQEMYKNALTLTETRLKQIREEVAAGSKAAVDTLESAVQLLNFGISLKEARLNLLKSKLALSVHLWNSDGKPLEPGDNVIPAESSFAFLDTMARQFNDSNWNSRMASEHPLLVSANLDVQSSMLDVRLKKQNLLPDLSLKYRMLAPGSLLEANGYNTDNYQFGIKFGTSLFLRKERGDYQLAKLKQQSYEWKLTQKNRELSNKSNALWKQRTTYAGIARDYGQVVDGYDALYKTELTRLDAGESNMFLVNTRELRLIDSRLKWIQYNRKYIECNIDYLENAGVLWNLLN